MRFVERWQDGIDLTAVVGFDGHFIWLNSASADWIGWSQATMRCVDWWEFCHPEHQDSLVTVAEALMNNGEFTGVPVLALRADGRYGSLIFDCIGDPGSERTFGVARPTIPDRQQSEQIAVGEWCLASGFTADHRTAGLLGLPADTPVSLNDLLERVVPRDRTRLRRALQVDIARAESIGETVHIADHEHGLERLVRVTGGPTRTSDAGPPRSHGLVRHARRNGARLRYP